MNKVTEPETIIYLSKNASLGYPIFVKGDKINLNWVEGKLELHKVNDKDKIKELDRLIESQYQKDEQGNYITNERGERLIKPKVMPLPFVKFDEFQERVKSGGTIIIELNGEYISLTADEVKNLIKENKSLKGKKDK